MFELAKPKIKLADLKHRVALCSMKDVVEKDGMMHLTREPVTWIWALVDAALNLPSYITPAGYAHDPSRNAWGTHRIIVRAKCGLEITTGAWIYEQRLQSSPRWFKSLGFTESAAWLLIIVHLMERSEMAQPPNSILEAMPQDVRL